MRRATSALAALTVGLALLVGVPAASQLAERAAARATGGDRATALRVATALLAQTPPVQLTKVRCERLTADIYCGLTLSGVKFHRRIDTAAFDAEVDKLVYTAFTVDPHIVEVDLWATVPQRTGKGSVVTGDFALSAFATVYATTVRRSEFSRPSAGPNVFWDPEFARELAAGSNG